MIILSREPVSEDDMKRIEEILRDSNCPRKTLEKTFDRFSGIYDTVIAFDGVNPLDYVTEKINFCPPE